MGPPSTLPSATSFSSKYPVCCLRQLPLPMQYMGEEGDSGRMELTTTLVMTLTTTIAIVAIVLVMTLQYNSICIQHDS